MIIYKIIFYFLYSNKKNLFLLKNLFKLKFIFFYLFYKDIYLYYFTFNKKVFFNE